MKEHGPESEHDNDERDLFFAHHCQDSKHEEPHCPARIHKIEREEQQGRRKRHGMKIVDGGLLQGRVKQIQNRDGYSSQFAAQSQACQPEGRIRAYAHYQRLQD